MIEMAKRISRKITSGQKGQVLPIVLILLVIGGLLVVPTLQYASTSLKGHQVTEMKAQELYAADSGVEDAIYWSPQLWQNGGSAGPYSSWIRSSYEINDRSVDVTVENITSQTYKITSTATSDSGSTTTIESYVSVWLNDFSDLLQSAITSNSTITIQPGSTISGNVTLPDYDDLDNKGTINGTVNEEVLVWPTADQLCDFYQDGVNVSAPFLYDTIDLKYTDIIGPLYRDGSLTIKNTASSAKNVTLEGTVYVKGDLTVKPDCGIVLNGNTIFAEGTIDLQPGCSVYGSGCIIAVGDVFFNPSVSSEPGHFLLIMSITGDVALNPSGDFYGAIVGNVEIDIQPGNSLNWVSPEGQVLDFPMGDEGEHESVGGVEIVSWKIE